MKKVRDQCRARDCGKGKVTVINKGNGKSTASRAIWCPAQLVGHNRAQSCLG